MVKVETLLAKYGATWEMALQWASTHPKWSKWISNKRLISRQFLLDTKNVDVKDELSLGTKLEPTAKISDLEVGKWQTIRGIVVSKIRETVYMGCPKCFKKIDTTKEELCEKHGEEAIELYWRTYVFADTDDDIVLSVPPAMASMQLLNREILARGSLNDQLEFNANKIQVTDEEPGQAIPAQPAVQQVAAPVPVAPVQTFAAPPVQAAPTADASTINADEVKQFADIMKVFKTLGIADAQNWHTGNHIKTPLMALITAANCEIQGTTVKVK